MSEIFWIPAPCLRIAGASYDMQGQRRENFMKISKIIIYVFAVAVLCCSMCGCGGKEDRPEEPTDSNTESNRQSSTGIRPVIKFVGVAEGLQKQVEQVRNTFMSLQKVCRANDIEGYLDFWDYETKMLDGRDLSLDERRERTRKSLTKRPETLQEIANSRIKSITVDTSQAEKIEALSGAEIEGTMMLVRTTGRALLFHETDEGWKLFTIASPGYFR
jgi:hypothetical protein